MTRKRLVSLALAVSPAVIFAEDTASGQLNTVINDVKTGLTGMIDTILPAVGGIVVAGLAFWGLRALVRWARSYFGK